MKDKIFSTITIEPTNICSLKCPGCPHGSNFFDGKEQGFMKFNDFKKIIGLNKEYIDRVMLVGVGEPFLNKDLMAMMTYCSDSNIDMGVHTNGMFLNRKTIERFKEIKTETIITFSLDGANENSYNIYRVGGSFKLVRRNMESLIKFKRKNKLLNIKVEWQFLLMQGNRHDLKKAREISKEINVDMFTVKNIVMTGKIDDDRYLPVRNRNYLNSVVDEEFVEENSNNSICEFIEPGSPFILWDGNVVPCCVDYKRKNIVGNAFTDKLIDLWDNKVYKVFRDKHINKSNKLCFNCRLKN